MPLITGSLVEVIVQAAKLLANGEVVALPTETVYGLAANALDVKAVNKVFKIKERPNSNPLIVHIANVEQISKYATPLDKRCYLLTEQFWPGPLSIILPKKQCIPNTVTAGMNTVALRSPNHPVTLAILKLAQLPLAAPSANPFTYVSPTCAQHVIDTLDQKQVWVVDGGDCRRGIESTIIDLSQPKAKLLRLGPIGIEEIEETLGETIEHQEQHLNSDEALASPGLLKKHYQPHTQVRLRKNGTMMQNTSPEAVAIVYIKKPPIKDSNVFWLSNEGDLSEAAANLYQTLRRLDNGDYSEILMELAPNEGLGKSINDRLMRAGSLS